MTPDTLPATFHGPMTPDQANRQREEINAAGRNEKRKCACGWPVAQVGISRTECTNPNCTGDEKSACERVLKNVEK